MQTINLLDCDPLTFDDVLLVPDYSEGLPDDANLKVELHPKLTLNIPILSAAMDTVSEAAMAIALARQGGMAVIHRNLGIQAQAAEIDKVKRSESGMITDPIILRPGATLAEARSIMARYHISGIPVTDSGVLAGILTNRDIRFAADNELVSHYMTKKPLVTARVGATLEDAKAILHEHRIEKLLLVDEDFKLRGLITYKDILKKMDFPLQATDEKGRLLVAAAVGVGDELDNHLETLLDVEVDAIVVDTAHGHSKNVIQAIHRVRMIAPELPVIAGNVVTGQGTQALIDAGADIIKIGIGAGSICTTRIIAGVGVPQITAIAECSNLGVPIIADGGIKYSGDIVKALAAGASAVMLGSLLAGLEESPGDVVLYEGKRFKAYRGMGSEGAMRGATQDRYGGGQKVPEGVEGQILYKGHLADFIYQLMGGLKAGMGYIGVRNLEEIHTAKFIQITGASLLENHPHGISIIKEAPNYRKL